MRHINFLALWVKGMTVGGVPVWGFGGSGNHRVPHASGFRVTVGLA